MNILICSIGKHKKIVEYVKNSITNNGRVIVTSNSNMLPSLYVADKFYIMKDILHKDYIDDLINICITENIDVITTMLDLETLILSKNIEKFKEIGVEVLLSSYSTSKLCFNKYDFYKYLILNNIPTIKTYNSIDGFKDDFFSKHIEFPVFVKPNNGRGSVGAKKIYNMLELEFIMDNNENYIIQEYIEGLEIYADVYIDTISKEVVSIFLKEKIGNKIEIGGTSRAISRKDDSAIDIIINLCNKFNFLGPINIDMFFCDGKYIINEVNPRFSGSYLHAHLCNVDFIKLIENNINGIKNIPKFNNYKENLAMMMFSEVLLLDMSKTKQLK